ncbi:MAG: hypothetical protein JNM40_04240 [Myxococcales bacterium]|nr:hypothetical protein [Myxococcales bacterium]
MTTYVSPHAAVVELLIDALLGRPLGDILPPARLCATLQQLGRLYLPSSQAEQHAILVWQRLDRLLDRPGTLRDVVPPPIVDVLRTLLSRPYLLPRPLLVSVLSRPPLRRLSRELMIGTLLDYSRKVRTQVGEVSQSRGGMLGRLATEAVKKSTSAIGSLAPGVTAAVSDELERQFRSRASEFADSAVDDLAQRLAAILTDPARMAEHKDLARSLLDFALDLPLQTVRAELTRLDPLAVTSEVRRAVHAWLLRPESEAELLALLQLLSADLSTHSLTSLLGEAATPLRQLLQDLFTTALRP